MAAVSEDALTLTPEDRLALSTATLDSRAACEAARQSPASYTWLKPSLKTEQGAEQVFELLQQFVERPEYLATLTTAKQHAERARASQQNGDPGVELREVEQQWTNLMRPSGGVSEDGAATSAGQVSATDTSGSTEDISDNYVMVQKEEVLEAMGTFIAGYIATVPDARDLKPEQLQIALQSAFKEIRKSNLRNLWEWGRSLYRAAAVSYAAFSMFQNPWLVMAILKATWAAAKFLLGAAL